MKTKIPKAYVINKCIQSVASDSGCSISEAEHIFNESMPKKDRLKMIKRKRRDISNAKR